jgi:CubicO group peptidase (beta-lactamase class C family)
MTRTMRRILLVVLVVLGLSIGAGSQQAPSLAAVFQELDTQLAADFARDGIGGASVGVVSGDALVWTKNYGYADAEAKRMANADTAYRIGSVTKQFTALVLLKLVEEGKVRLTDPVEKHYPAIAKVAKFHPDAPSITLLQLATMTSGLAREPEKMPNHSVGAVSGWQQKVRDAVPFMRYQYEPGTQYLYSNIGYATLGLALEQAAGQSFTGYVEAQILKPLGMSRTVWEATPAIRTNLAHGYARRQDGSGAPTGDRSGPDRELEGRGYRVPNGALFSTVNDLAKFVVWELGGGPATVLKRETQTANYTRVYTSTSTAAALTGGYGIGFMANRRGDQIFLGHGGSTAGYRASALFHRESKTGVVILRNADDAPGSGFNAGGVANRVLERVIAAKAVTTAGR